MRRRRSCLMNMVKSPGRRRDGQSVEEREDRGVGQGWEKSRTGQGKHSSLTGEDGIMGAQGTSVETAATLESLTLGRVPPARGQVMDRLREFLDLVSEQGLATSNFLGLLHIIIGRKITLADGTEVSRGQTWRDLAALLKKLRWEPEVVREPGLDPADLP